MDLPYSDLESDSGSDSDSILSLPSIHDSLTDDASFSFSSSSSSSSSSTDSSSSSASAASYAESDWLEAYHLEEAEAGTGTGTRVEASGSALHSYLERQLEASVFQIEPVTHITYQLLYVDDFRELERVERHVMQLRVPNVIDRFDVGRIIKAARWCRNTEAAASSAPLQGCLYRLEALFVYNVDITFKELGSLLLAPAFPADRFITALSSISNFTLRPTMACFHSANSIHIVLSRIRNAAATAVTATAVTATAVTATAVTAVDSGESKRRVVITPAASTRRRRPH